ncbi:MAG: histidine kinase [Nocardioidaceae bacterium]
MTVDSTGDRAGAPTRTLPASWPDLAFGGAVLVVGLIEAFARYAVTGPALAVIGCLAVAAGFFRLRPGLALALVWVAALSVLVGGARLLFPLLSVLAVSFGVARWGRPLTVWLGGLSIPAVGVVAAWWSAGYGIPSPPLVLDALRGGYWPDIPVAQMFAWGLTMLVPLGLPFIVGLALRSTASSRASQVAAEESRDLAEARREEAEHAQQQAQEIARLREGQAQLARDVHDVVGHSLAVILAQAEAARTLPESDVAGMREAMGNVADSARQSLRDVRQVLSTTRTPGAAGSAARRGGLAELIEGVTAAGNDVRATVIGDPVPLPPELDQVAYRVLQEMLTNALKHGRPGGPVWVEQTWGGPFQPDELRLEVANIARDVTPPTPPVAGLDMTQPIRPGETSPVSSEAAPDTSITPAPPSGMGLVSMRQRLDAVGGRLALHRRPGPDGDVVTATAWLPLRAAEVR